MHWLLSLLLTLTPLSHLLYKTRIANGGTNRRLQKVLRDWDSGTKHDRRRMLVEFISVNKSKTGVELERYGAFLTIGLI
jgi:hypothetical protein